MTIGPGSRVGPYEVTALVGQGGMGKVWRAHHTTLKRDDALKVLPDAFASDPERLARFRREAQVLASLNYPNIAHVYGLEQSGAVQALVMELVEGPTLADRIAQGPIPLDEALPIAKQIAEALEAAHEQGIVHRDLKPANIKVRTDGTVKVLDFGLAKALEPMSTSGVDVTASPTITSPAMMTGVGVLLGTAAYMSPEQARGNAVDKRSDMWAFGCVLFEMLSSRRAFQGDDISDTLAAVLRAEPEWSVLAADTPRSIRQLVRRCLAKDRKARLDSATAARLEIEEALAGEKMPVNPAPLERPHARHTMVLLALALLLAAGLAGAAAWYKPRAPVSPVSRLTISLPSSAELSLDGTLPDLAITPDGTRVVYVGANGTQVFVRALDALQPVAIAKGSPRGVFVSPDGQWVGFFDGNVLLKKVAITGGPTTTIATLDSTPRGGTWLRDDTIVFATASMITGLQRVASAGGTPAVMTKPDTAQGELDHWSPVALPDGRSVLFSITARTGGIEATQVAVVSADSTELKVLVRGGTAAQYVTTGHLLYGAAGTLWAVAFDLTRLETRGTPWPAVPEVLTTSTGMLDAVVSTNGTLTYVPGGLGSVQRTLVWVDRQGQESPITVPPRPYVYPRVAPDARRIAVGIQEQENDLWLWDIERTTLTRITYEPGFDFYPVWTPDGRRVVFASDRGGGVRNLFWQTADGTGAVERLTESENVQDPSAVSPDGARVIFHETSASNGLELMELSLESEGAPNDSAAQPKAYRVKPLVQTPFTERNGVVSPDGRWLAYEADDSGQFEIYVRPYPNVSGGVWQVSTDGGTRALWDRTGRELFYLSPRGALLGVAVDASTDWATRSPTTILKEGYFTVPGGNPGRSYDISSDGKRFLMIKPSSQSNAQLVVVQNWFDELKRLVPTN